MRTRIVRGLPRNHKNIVGARVRAARLGISPAVTQDDLAGRLAARGIAIDRSAIARVELGCRYVLDFELVAIAAALNTTTAYLLGETEDHRIHRRA